jgi:predicted dehydrogenase
MLKATAAASLAVPCIVPSSVLGNQETPPSERVTVGHIAAGNRARALTRGFMQCKNYQGLAVADCYEDRRESMAKIIQGEAYADFRKILDRDDIDAVVIATPDHWHVPIAIMAAESGKDAYVEKPLGVSIEEDLKCREVFKKHRRVFQYGTQQRSSAHCRLGCELALNGAVGPVERIEVIAPNGGSGGSTEEVPVPEGFDYAMWNGPAPHSPYTVDRCKPPGTYWIYDYSIGYLGGWGAHPLDIMVWGNRSDLAGPFTVAGTGKIPTEGLYDTVYDWDMTLEMHDGVTITFKPGPNSTKFIGPKGWIEVTRAKTTADPASLLEEVMDDDARRLRVSAHHQQNFLDGVRERVDGVSNLEDAVRSDIISLLCDIAVRCDRKITWDPEKRTILDDAEAAERMHRDMRAPWNKVLS